MRMKQFVTGSAAALLTLIAAGPMVAGAQQSQSPVLPLKGAEGPGIRKVEPKGTEGPEVRKQNTKKTTLAKVPKPKVAEGTDARAKQGPKGIEGPDIRKEQTKP